VSDDSTIRANNTSLLAVAGSNARATNDTDGVNCFDNTGALLTDQRGRPRPPSASNRCDIGAFEYNEIFADGF